MLEKIPNESEPSKSVHELEISELEVAAESAPTEIKEVASSLLKTARSVEAYNIGESTTDQIKNILSVVRKMLSR